MSKTRNNMGKKANKNSTLATLSPKKFRKQFDRLTPLILEEWQQLELDELVETQGNLDSVVDYITRQTEQTRTLVKDQLHELYQLAKTEKTEKIKAVQSDLAQLQDQMLPAVEKTLDLLEKRAETVLAQMEQGVLADVKDRVREKPGTSLLTALGIGFLIGLIVGGSNRGRG
ncbi:hypothetical protein [Egbenema bharatensis]|uniref:hypothetical protein n=1 Tax=Egbenema bharatensis TaxID=3463334 RepID=UPI003A8485E3